MYMPPKSGRASKENLCINCIEFFSWLLMIVAKHVQAALLKCKVSPVGVCSSTLSKFVK